MIFSGCVCLTLLDRPSHNDDDINDDDIQDQGGVEWSVPPPVLAPLPAGASPHHAGQDTDTVHLTSDIWQRPSVTSQEEYERNLHAGIIWNDKYPVNLNWAFIYKSLVREPLR